MPNHPNRPQRAPVATSPSPDEVRAARAETGLTQEEAADVVYRTLNSWQRFEQRDGPGQRKMDPAIFELFRIKAGLDPAPAIVSNAKRDPADHDL